MSDLLQTMSLAASGMQAQSSRLRLVSENLANADTPGYRRKTAAFETVMARHDATRPPGAVHQGPVQLDQSELKRIYDPGHPLADPSGHYAGSNVDMMIEVADAREAQRSYEANLKLFDQARKMSAGLLELLRR
ncbi:flagellar basal-body rod protein FlgC [Tranquillimonas rosea]|uniref:Flagellar basal body rod protein FlgB n=1 Tax=Tranquillimonas rosea TaxID=641238 RepID=A0A1H9X4V0_9RHOB|nr:flagellar basal body rod protein FlgC [Tranquillimonas rosea]SES41180.1 flagellar basal-body rod protein FlgC [Tranquillimonas rosea]